MGWWKASFSGTNVTIGDGPLDTLTQAISDIAGQYLYEIGRQPTSDEILCLLHTAIDLRDNESDQWGYIFDSSLDNPKETSSSRQWKANDIIAIPLRHGMFGFGVIRLVSDQMGPLMEFSNYTSEDISNEQTVIAALQSGKWLFYAYVDTHEIQTGRWVIIGQFGYKSNAKASDYPMVRRNLLEPSRSVLVIGERTVRRATPAELTSLPPRAILGSEVVEERLQQEIGAL